MSEGNQNWIRARIETLRKQTGFAFNQDLFVSILLCLISGRNKHLVLTAPPDRLNEISQMAAQISRCIFGLTTATTTCRAELTRADLIDVLFDLKEDTDTGRYEQHSRSQSPAQQSSLQKHRSSTPTLNSNSSEKSQADNPYRNQGKNSARHPSGINNDDFNSMYTPPVNPVDFNLRKRDNRAPFNLTRANPSTSSVYANSISRRELLMSHNKKEKSQWTMFNAIAPTRIAQSVIVQELDKSNESVQALLLELIVTKELRISNIKYNVPKPVFLIIAVLPHGYNRLAISSHLMDRFFINFSFDDDMFNYPPQPGFIGRSLNHRRFALFKYEEVKTLSEKANEVHVNIDINRYIRDIVVGIRTHPRVKGGLTVRCSQDLLTVLKSLAALFNTNFLTPDLVMSAAAKVFSHRLHVLAISATDDQMEQEDMNPNLPAEIVQEILSIICVPV